MTSITILRLMLRLGFLLGLAGLAIIGLRPDLPVHAEDAVRPMLQSTDDYPPLFPTDFFEGYPFVTDTPPANGNRTPTATQPGYPANTPGPGPTRTRPAGTAVPTQPGAPTQPTLPPVLETPTIDPSITISPDAFRTEDAEMGGSQDGTPTTPTPSPEVTASVTASPSDTVEATASRMTAPEDGDSEDGFEMNWGLFWIGFSIPVIGACGVVLYLLDRRPELFRSRPKGTPIRKV